ncbi:MAG: DNA-directed RNA polymerase subunit A' [archaeon]
MREPIRKQVKELRFALLSPEQIKRLGAAKVVTPELYDMDGYPVDGGLMDLRLGAIGPGIRCRTCGKTMKECPGHFGYIELARSVLHIKYLKLMELCLKSTCQECGKILLKEDEIKARRIDKAKNVKKCPYCSAKQDKVKLEKPSSFYLGKKRIFPTEIRDRLVKISDEDCKILGINPESCRPEWAILTLVVVPPVTTRPSITLDTGERSEDDLTHKLSDIVRSNQRLWENLNAGAPEVIIEDLWDLLQYHITTFFDNSMANVPPARHRSGQPLKTITERIKGKGGRIRHNLAGKRVNFSSRTVISPDPYIDMNEVGIPEEVANTITIPERMNEYNLEHYRDLIKNNNKVITISTPDGKRKRVAEDIKEQLAEELELKYSVERSLHDKDVVLFNRHPSLHRMSLMAHFVKVLPGRTFRIHPGVAPPYNADFDGDEMNIHAPQTEEARTEAKILMDVNEHLMSPKNNTNVLGCVEDAITGLYLLTLTENISKKDAVQFLISAGLSPESINLTKDHISGRELITQLLPKINFESKNKACKGKECPNYDKCKKEDCPNMGYVSIKNGKFISGIIDGEIMGVETNTLITALDQQVGRKETMDFLKKIFLLSILFLTPKGLTVSLADVETTQEQDNETKRIITDTEKKVEKIIDDYYAGKIEILPGKTMEETREIKILQVLNEIRTKVSEVVRKSIKKTNPLYIMMVCGGRGNLLFVTQMSNVVGQQALWAKRINFGYHNRTLSFYKENDLSAKAGGFVESGFLKGLNPAEFFFISITGRDGLMDTALRTPKSGYLYRRLRSALEDIRIEYDGTVRDSNSNIIQFEYGEDGVEVSKMHLKDNQIAPGEAIGVVTAESFGEPATQMTLNVFHFAGVSEMQIMTGLPRLIEIFDARKIPSTPSMEVYLDKEHNNEKDVKKIAARIREIQLEDVSEEISIDFVEGKINVKLNKEILRDLALLPDTIIEVLGSKLIKARKVQDGISIKTKKEDKNFKELYRLKEKIKKLIIRGVKGIKQVLPVKREGGEFVILTAGSNLSEVLEVKGVNKEKTITNDIHEIRKVLGVEAARQAIIEEVTKVIEKQGLVIDTKHIKLVADAMTSAGEVKGVTRVGIIRDKTSILARASFETPIKHFVNATIKHSTDKLLSVVENIILNQPVPVGTGLPGLLVKITDREALARKDGKKSKGK